MFYALDNTGKRIEFDKEVIGNSSFFTLKKEKIADAKALEVHSDLTSAIAGEDGFYIIPRYDNLLGDVYTTFREE